MRKMADPNFFVKDNESMRSFQSKSSSLSKMSRGPNVKASFNNEFAYKQIDKRPHSKSVTSRSQSQIRSEEITG